MSSEPAAEFSRRPRWSQTVKVMIAVVALIALVAAAYLFRIVFIPLVIGAIIAYLLYPLVQRIRGHSRLPHGLVTTVIYVLLIVIINSLIASVIPLIFNTLNFWMGELSEFATYVNTVGPNETVVIAGFQFRVQDVVAEATTALVEIMRSVIGEEPLALVFGVAETFLLVIVTLLFGYYLTRDVHNFIGWAQGMVPHQYEEDIRQLMVEINSIWSAFFRGQFILAALVTVIITVFSAALGLPNPLLLGVLAGLLEFLPSIGHGIWGVTAVVIALVEGSTYLPISKPVFALLVAVLHLLFSQFDLNYLIPRIIGRQIHLHPMIVIMGIIVGAAVGGVLGVALAAPVIASLRVVGRYIYAMMFDLDPFPMIGPPTASKAERMAELERQQQAQPRVLRGGGAAAHHPEL